jgi:hypothetical protein
MISDDIVALPLNNRIWIGGAQQKSHVRFSSNSFHYSLVNHRNSVEESIVRRRTLQCKHVKKTKSKRTSMTDRF